MCVLKLYRKLHKITNLDSYVIKRYKDKRLHQRLLIIMEEVLRGGGNRNSSMRTGRRVIVE